MPRRSTGANLFMDKLQEHLQAATFTTKKDEDGKEWVTGSEQNREAVLLALTRAAVESGHITLGVFLSAACPTKEVARPS